MENVNLFVELALEVKRLGAELEALKKNQAEGFTQGSFKDWVSIQIDDRISLFEESIEHETERMIEKAIENADYQEIFDNLDLETKVREELREILKDI